MEDFDYDLLAPETKPKKEWTAWNSFVLGMMIGLLILVCVTIALSSLDLVSIFGKG